MTGRSKFKMTTNYHTPYQDNITKYRALHMNAPLGQLDAAIEDVKDALVEYSGSASIVIAYQSEDKPPDAVVVNVLATFPFTIGTNLLGSKYFAVTGPAAQVVITFQKNGVQFGTLTISAGVTSGGTWSGTVTTFDAGDRLSVIFPAIQDTTLAGVTLSIHVERIADGILVTPPSLEEESETVTITEEQPVVTTTLTMTASDTTTTLI
jgi:hypothetical protein